MFDITRTIGLDTLTYPGDEPAQLQTVVEQADGYFNEHTTLRASCHTGTHLDVPAHFIEGGRRLDDYSLDNLTFDAVVVDTGDAAVVEPHHVAGVALVPGAAVLFKTRNARLPRDQFSGEYCHISPAAADALAGAGVGLVGIDYLSVDPVDSSDYPAHAILLGCGALILEDADLRQVSAGEYRLRCFPLKLHNTEAAPCRAILEPR